MWLFWCTGRQFGGHSLPGDNYGVHYWFVDGHFLFGDAQFWFGDAHFWLSGGHFNALMVDILMLVMDIFGLVLDILVHIRRLWCTFVVLKMVLGHNFDAKKVLDYIIMMLKRALWGHFDAKKDIDAIFMKSSYAITWRVCACAVYLPLL